MVAQTELCLLTIVFTTLLNSVDRNLLRLGNARPRVPTVRVDIVSFAGLLYPCDENSFAD